MQEYEIDPWANLANAIVAQAAHDYAQAVVDADESGQKHFEYFVKSGWFRILTEADPEYLVAKVREGAEQFKALADEFLEGLEEVERPRDAFKCPLCGGNVRTRHTTMQTYKGRYKLQQKHYVIVKCLWCELENKKFLFSKERDKRNYGKERRAKHGNDHAN